MVDTTYRILLLGDFHFGESYSVAGARVLAEKGYEHSVKHLLPFIDRADTFIVNLETPIVSPEKYPSPLRGDKTYIHWADPEKTPQALKKLDVDAVSLANNHTVDHGVDGLLSSFEQLSKVGIPWFGAGRDLVEARRPYQVSLPERLGSGKVLFYGSFEYSKVHDHRFGFYAKEDTPGCAPLALNSPRESSFGADAEDAFHVAFPHWGSNYKWRTSRQRQLGDMLLDQGCDLVLGHGSHCLQQLELRKRRWVAYSIGNGNFQSGGRFQRYIAENGILPMGAWAMLHIELNDAGARKVHLRLYPVYSDNRATGFRPGPVTETDFRRVREEMRKATHVRRRFDNDDRDFGRDELGWYLRAELGEWPVGGKPKKLNGPKFDKSGASTGTEEILEETALGVYLDPDSLYVRDQQANVGRNVAPLLISRVAEKDGAETEWVDSRIAVIQDGDRRILLQGHRGSESAVGKSLIGDKYLSKRLLAEAGVSTPRGDLAHTPDEAIAFQRRAGSPVVVKPRFGLKGLGVSVNLTSPEKITEAFRRAEAVRGGVVVEEYIDAVQEYRCLTTPDECVSVVRRILPSIKGDGHNTILELIRRKNEQRRLNPSTFGRPIPIDEVTETYLKRVGLSYDHVPAAGKTLTVRDVGGLSSGGEPHEYSAVAGAHVKETAAQAVRAIPGLSWGGADVMISRETGDPYVIEINSDADISGASFPFYGEPVNVAEHIWRMRIEAADADVISRPLQPPAASDGQELGALTPEVWTDKTSARFSEVFLAVLASKGYKVHAESPTISRVVDPDGLEHWLRGGLSVKDLAVVSEVVRRHRIVRRLLRSAEVPRTRGTRVQSLEEVQRFLGDERVQVVAVPYRDEWNSSRMQFSADADDWKNLNLSSSESWIIQKYPPGTRLQVFAAPEGGMAVLGSSPLKEAELEESVNVATRAIRAVPGLRWGIVDVVVTAGRRALVEGISHDPVVMSDYSIIAGSIDAFSALIYREKAWEVEP